MLNERNVDDYTELRDIPEDDFRRIHDHNNDPETSDPDRNSTTRVGLLCCLPEERKYLAQLILTTTFGTVMGFLAGSQSEAGMILGGTGGAFVGFCVRFLYENLEQCCDSRPAITQSPLQFFRSFCMDEQAQPQAQEPINVNVIN